MKQIAYLSLGSNIGDRVGNLNVALEALGAFVFVQEISSLYETPAAYVTDQSNFLNAVCRVATNLSPTELLDALEKTMLDLGRRRSIRYGPRVIDIDILFYEGLQLKSDRLSIPHPLLPERDFILEPLCDIAPDFVHPGIGKSIQTLWDELHVPPLTRVMPIGNRLWSWGQKTYIMGILNITPDSFSGDGLVKSEEEIESTNVVQRTIDQARRFVAEGADCLDIGGLSTRPGHELVSVDTEIARVVPVIEALASEVDRPISIDTFRSEVAAATLEAGAQMINDVWGTRYDHKIAQLAIQSRVPLIVMHNRMEPTYLDDLEQPNSGAAYEYTDIIDDIHQELAESLTGLQHLGIPRWNLIADPGMGFGKNLKQQLELIHRFRELQSLDYPLLFSASRKGFIGKVLDETSPTDRVEGTLAATVLAIDRGADIVRVHDVRQIKRAVRMTDAIIRRPMVVAD